MQVFLELIYMIYAKQKLSEVERMGRRIVVDKGMQSKHQEEALPEVVHNPEIE
jgi:hypothetical protein